MEQVADDEPDEVGDDVEIDDVPILDKRFQFTAPTVVRSGPHHQERQEIRHRVGHVIVVTDGLYKVSVEEGMRRPLKAASGTTPAGERLEGALGHEQVL